MMHQIIGKKFGKFGQFMKIQADNKSGGRRISWFGSGIERVRIAI